jgi:Poly(R)-hydroxyalkanoic acid synthase subunit (PHA_synth_III_E)
MVLPHEQAASLYRYWWESIESAFRALAPATTAPAMPTFAENQPGAGGVHETVKPIADALELNRRLLERLYGVFIPLLGNTASLDWQAIQKKMLDNWASAFANPAQAGAEGRSPLSTSYGVFFANPLYQGVERTFAALTDAFGFGPSKILQDALSNLIAAERERQVAQIEYVTMLGTTWRQIVEGVTARLSEMASKGEAGSSLLGWARLWASVADECVHQTMQSERGLEITAKYIRAVLRLQQSRNRLIELVSETLNVPTRAEMDEAYREIQQLKRQLRQLRHERQPPAKRKLTRALTQDQSDGKND